MDLRRDYLTDNLEDEDILVWYLDKYFGIVWSEEDMLGPSDSELAENIISGEIALALDQLFQRVL